MKYKALYSVVLASFFSVGAMSDVVAAPTGTSISGELKKWHKVTITFDGPNVKETDTKNPFTDYLSFIDIKDTSIAAILLAISQV